MDKRSISFDAQYKERGGIEKLLSLYKQGESNSAIARYFDTSETRVTYALKDLLGDKYIGYPFRKLTML